MVDMDGLHQQLVSFLATGASADDLRDAVEAAIDAAVEAGVIPPEDEEIDEDDAAEDD